MQKEYLDDLGLKPFEISTGKAVDFERFLDEANIGAAAFDKTKPVVSRRGPSEGIFGGIVWKLVET